jgi:L-gulonate 3-dehydrogenase
VQALRSSEALSSNKEISVKKIACIGAGNVGRSWAMVFARAGHQVQLYDVDADTLRNKTMSLIEASLADQQSAGLLDDAVATGGRITPCLDLETAVADADYVQESVFEDASLKRELFGRLDALAQPDCILASSTSAIPGSEFMQALQYPERALVVHPVNPPHLIPLVELCRGPGTADSTLSSVQTFMESLGQVPIVVRSEIAGFILNRLQFTLVGELMHLVSEGYCSAEDADKVVKHGLALRWAFLGPTEVAHLNASEGFLGFVDGLGDMMKRLARDSKVDYPWTRADAEKIHEPLSKQMPIEQISEYQRWRDRRIMALRNHLQTAESPKT